MLKIESKLVGRGISESSLNLYKRNLERLNDNKEIKNLNFLKDTEEIIKKIKEKKPTTARSYIIAICSTLKDDVKMKKYYDIYYNLLCEYNKDLKTNNSKSEKQLKEWITQDEIKSIYNKLEEEIKPLFKKRNLSVEEYNKLLSYIVLSIYHLNPPRRNLDYLELIVIPKKKEGLNTDFNYFDIYNKQFIFNNYKTKGAYSEQIIPINEKLYIILLSWVKKMKIQNYLLVDALGNKLNKNGITNILYKIFNKKVGSQMLRTIYITEKYKDINQEKIDDAKAMGNSPAVIDAQYVKTD